jgi:maltose/moltooligosaccharide transporter
MSEKDMRKKAAKIDYATVAFASLPFMGMISFWQVFDGIIPKMLTQTFGLSNAVTGFVMAIDNIFGLFLLPLFGILSDAAPRSSGAARPSSLQARSWPLSERRSSQLRTMSAAWPF